MEKKKPFYEQVAEKLIEQLKQGTAPWQKPWDGGGLPDFMPHNTITGRRYRGINNLWLQAQGRKDPRWMTYKQAASIGAQVRRGEKGTVVEYWKFTEEINKTDEKGREIFGEDGKPEKVTVRLERPRVFHAVVFNAEQIDGLPPIQPRPLSWNPDERAEDILKNSGANIIHTAGDRAFYSLNKDSITLPLKEQFSSQSKYYEVALHELGHWTGHADRLNRDLSHPFGSEGYAREELRAEIASLMLSQELGIPFDPKQHASYVGSWVQVLQDDPMEILRAASDAEKIQGYVMAFEQVREIEQENEMAMGITVQEIIHDLEGNAQLPEEQIRQFMPEQQEEAVRVISDQKVYVQIPYADKDQAKILGARWDKDEKSWYIPPGVNQEPFGKWLNSAVNQAQSVDINTPAIENTLINVPFQEKDEARALGAKWDKGQKSWYIPEGVNTALFERWMMSNRQSETQHPAHDEEADIIRSVANGSLGKEIDKLESESNLGRLGWIDDVLKEMNTLNPESAFWQKHTTLAVTLGITSEEAFEATQYKDFDENLEKFIDRIDDAICNVQDNISEQQVEFVQQEHQLIPAEEKQVVGDVSRVYLAVSYEEKDEAKGLGAKWDKASKSWFMEADNPNLASASKWLPENQSVQTTPAMSPVEEFADKLREMGCVVEKGHPFMDGQKHRIETIGDKKGERSGFYVAYLDGHPAGYIKNNRTSEEVKWKAKGYSLSPEEKAKLAAESAQKLQMREEQKKQAQEAAVERIKRYMRDYEPIRDETPYLKAKGISPQPGIFTDKSGEKTYIPVYNAKGELRSMQYIQADGTKRFAKDSEQEGGMHVVGQKNLASAKTIILSEGYATAASIDAVTDASVASVATFNSGNLPIVAKELQGKYPQAKFLVAGDDDLAVEVKQGHNPGKEKATEAAKILNCQAIFPVFARGEQSPENKVFTDFNDLAQKSKLGKAGLSKQINEAIHAKSTQELQTFRVNSMPNVEQVRQEQQRAQQRKVTKRGSR